MKYFKIFFLVFIVFSNFTYSQSNIKDSLRGKFTYLLKSKPIKSDKNHVYQELFSLQIGNGRSFFISEKQLVYDSIAKAILKPQFESGSRIISMNGISLPKNFSRFSIIQEGDIVNFFSIIGMTRLTYENPIIKDWKILDEKKSSTLLNVEKQRFILKGETG